MAKLRNKQFDYGSVDISTDASGNGTSAVTFALTFNTTPEVKVVKPVNDVKGIYGAKNSSELILKKGRQPIGSISAYALGTGGAGYTKCTDDNAVASGSITAFADNGDGKTKVTDAAHGLDEGTVIQIYDALAASGMNGFFVVEQVEAAAAPGTFVIDREFVATGTASWQVLAHDLEDDDLIKIHNSSTYTGQYTVSDSAVGYFDIDETFTVDDTIGYWELIPTVTTTTMTVEVVGSDIRGGTVTVNWLAIER